MKKPIILLFSLISFLQAQPVQVRYGMTTCQNKRAYQEDHFKRSVINNGDFFGIYDGHGGDKTATYLAADLHHLMHRYTMQNMPMARIMEKAFLDAEQQVCQLCDDGSTALVVYIDENNSAHCAWAGDSRAVVEKDGKVMFETRDHKPNDRDELARITQYGGAIQKYGVWRVGGLAISRSIGDRAIKNRCPGQVIAKPDYAAIQLNKHNHFLIMASDGLWDVMSSKEAVAMVTKSLQNKEDVADTVRHMLNCVIARGSEDNITICVVLFDW